MPECDAVGTTYVTGMELGSDAACLTVTQAYEEVVTDFDGTTPETYDGALTAMSRKTVASVQDLNGDRLPDFIVADGIGSNGDMADGIYYRGDVDPVTRPGLLVEVQSGTGLITTFEHGHTVTIEPAAMPRFAASPQAAEVIASVRLDDPFDGGWAERNYEFFGRTCELGTCKGFAASVVRETFNQVDLLGAGTEDEVETCTHIATDAFTTSRATARVQLERYLDFCDTDYDPGDGTLATYGNLRYASAISYAGYGSAPFANANLWPAARTDTEFRGHLTANPTQRSIHSTTVFDARGNLLEAEHDAGTATAGDDVRTVATWAGDADGTRFRLCGYRHEVGGDTTEKAVYRYDGAATCTPSTLLTGPGLLTEQVVSAGPVGNIDLDTLVWDFAHDGRGQVSSITHPHGATTTTAYGFGGAVPESTTNAMGWLTTHVLDGMGRVIETTDPNGMVEAMAYDDFGRPTATWSQGVGGSMLARSVTSYVEATLDGSPFPAIVSRRMFNYGTGPTDVRAPTDVIEHLDGTGRVQRTATDHERGGQRVAWSWDGLLGEPQAEWVTSDDLTYTTHPAQVKAEDLDSWRVIESFGAELATWTGAAGLTSISYPEVGLTELDHAGEYTKRLHTDALERLVQVEESADPASLVTTGTYEYDPMDRVSAFVDANGNRYLYSYDGAGRLVDVHRDGASATSPKELWVNYEYDVYGPLPVQMNVIPTAQVTTWTYDDLGRPDKKTVEDPTSTGIYEWGWDLDWLGALSYTDDPTGRIDYTYEQSSAPFGARGLMVAEQRSWDTLWVTGIPQLDKLYTYDGQGQVLQTLWPSGAVVNTSYHANGKAVGQQLASGAASFSFEVGYDTWGAYESWETTNGADIMAINRNHRDQVGSFSWNIDRGPGNLEVGDLSYTYQADGLMLSRGTTTYDHDDLRRILPDPILDELDPLGVPVRWGGKLYQAPDDFAEVPQRTSSQYTYDSFGNVSGISELDWELEYDGAQRLVRILDYGEVQEPSGDPKPTTFHYDVDNGLVLEQRLDNGAREAGTVSFAGVHLRWDDTAGAWVRYEAALPWMTLVDGAPRYVLKEPFGQSVAVVDAVTGTKVADDQADIFGEDVGQSVGTWPLDQLHGGVRDTSDQLMHAQRRHYLVDDGRWLQPEPLLYEGLTNGNLPEPLGYGPVYARGNSNLFADPSGEVPLAAAGAAVIAVAEVSATVYDAYSAYNDVSAAFQDPSAANIAMATFSVGALAAGVAFPGGGYGLADDAVGFVDDGARGLREAATEGAERIAKTQCFVEGTEVLTPAGSQRIESVDVGDVVVAAASLDGGEESWVEVESAPREQRGAWAPSGMCDRVRQWAQAAAVPVAMLAACDVAELPAAEQVVQIYDARTGEWSDEDGAELEVGDTYIDDGRVLRVTEEGVEVRGRAGVADLAEADATWIAAAAHRVPGGDDWVLVLRDGDDAGHWRLSEVEAGDRFAFQGRVFDTADDDADGDLEVRATELVVSRVVQTFERHSDTVIDAEILYEDGTVEVITGTPEHPFWVPKRQEWVSLGELVQGTQLHVDSGAGAILVSSTWRHGDFTVYNFEVDATHNYFVRAPGSESTANILVHNICDKQLIRSAAEARQDAGALKNFEAPPGSGRQGGHANKHNWSIYSESMMDVRNNPEKIYVGTNSNGNDVVVFYKDNSVVITDAQDTTAVITAYGKRDGRKGSTTHDKYADDPNYHEVE